MDEVERKKKPPPSLPPDYVSLAQLQERWLKKQQEKKQSEEEKKLEEEKKQSEEKQNERVSLARLPPDYVSLAQLQERWLKKQEEKNLKEEKKQSENGGGVKKEKNEKDGPLVGLVDLETGEGKEIEQIGSVGNGEEKKKEKKKKRNYDRKKRYLKRKQLLAAKEKENSRDEDECCFEGVDGEIEIKNGYKRVELVGVLTGSEKSIEVEDKSFNSTTLFTETTPRNEVMVGPLHGESSGGGGIYGKSKGIEETMIVSMVDVLPENGVRKEVPNVKSVGFRGGFRRNGADRVTGSRTKEYRVKVKLHEYKSNEVEMPLEKKVVDGKGNGKDLVDGKGTCTDLVDRGRNDDNRGTGCKNKEYRVKIYNLKVNEVGMSLGNKVGDEKKNTKNWRNRRGNGERRGREYGLKESGAAMFSFKDNEVELKSDNMVEDEILEVGSKMDGLEGVHNLKVDELGMSFGKKVGDEKEYAKDQRNRRRNVNNRHREYGLKESGAAVHGCKGKEVELKSENMGEDEILDVGRKMDGLDGIDRNGLLGQDHRVEREGLNDNTSSMAPKKKGQDGDSVVDRMINGENGEARNRFRRYGNNRGHVGRKFGRLAFSDLSAGNVGDSRRYRSSGMVWVKKEEKSSVNAAEVGSSGNSLYQE